MRRALAAAALAALTGCAGGPDYYAVPKQVPPAVEQTSRPMHYIVMGDPAFEDQLLSGFGSIEDSRYRWIGRQAAMRFVVPSSSELRLQVHLFVPDVALTGSPLNISYLVNGSRLGSVRYDEAGSNTFEKPVDPELLVAGGDNIVTLALDKIYRSPDGRELGVTVSAAGFVD